MAPRAIHENAGPRSAPPPDARNERIALSARDLCVGCIVWLPARDIEQMSIKCDKSICCAQGELGDRGYDHPVIVLKIKQRQGSTTIGDLECSIACVTSFTATKLQDYLHQRLYKAHFQQTLPICDPKGVDIESFGLPCPPQIRLEDGRNLHKQSYVGLQHTYTVPLDLLRRYSRRCRAYKLRLEEESYKVLMRELGAAPEPYPETNTLFETVDARLAALARPMGGLSHTFVNPGLPIVIPTVVPRRTPEYAPYTSTATYTPSSPRNYGATPQIARATYPPPRRETAYVPAVPTGQQSCPPIRYDLAAQRHSQTGDRVCCSDRANRPEPDGCDSCSVLCIIALVAIGSFLWWKFG